jgi:annexin A7/11
MPPQPYQNPPAYPPQPAPYSPAPQLARANTYMPPLARPPTIYDTLGQTGPHVQVPLASPSPYPRSNYGPSPNVPTTPLRNYGPQSDFNPEKDCEALHKAVHGLGTDERAIINIIVNRNWAQRQEIRNYYKSCYGKDLIKRLKDDTSGNFKEVVAGMFMTPAEFDAMCLYKAMKGAGTKEGVLIEIIGTRTPQELMQVKDAFQREYNGSLEKWVRGDTSGNFRNLLVALLQCNRSMNPNPDPNQCESDAQALYNAGEGRLGTDEPTFIRIFSQRSAAELAMINDCYTRTRGRGLLKAVDKEFSGDIKRLLETVLGGLIDPAGYFAKRIREAVKGLGTNDSKLVRVIVSRSEIDLGRIKQAYQTIYGRDMLHDVRDDTSGYYKEILTGLISRC